MKNLFIDTNVLLDLLMERDGYQEAAIIMDMSGSTEFRLSVSVLSMSNIAYVLRKVLNSDELYVALNKLSSFLHIVSVSSEDYFAAVKLRARDFEDALQYFCAKSSGCDCIITRNIKDFVISDIPVVSSKNFLAENS